MSSRPSVSGRKADLKMPWHKMPSNQYPTACACLPQRFKAGNGGFPLAKSQEAQGRADALLLRWADAPAGASARMQQSTAAMAGSQRLRGEVRRM